MQKKEKRRRRGRKVAGVWIVWSSKTGNERDQAVIAERVPKCFSDFFLKKNKTPLAFQIPHSTFHIPSGARPNVTNVRAPGGRRVQGDGLCANWVHVFSLWSLRKLSFLFSRAHASAQSLADNLT